MEERNVIIKGYMGIDQSSMLVQWLFAMLVMLWDMAEVEQSRTLQV